MKKIRFCLISLPLLLLSITSAARVAYVPVTENYLTSVFYPDTRRLFVVDLENGGVIRAIDVGNGVHSVFVSNDSSRVYADAIHAKRIVEIDATKLEIQRSWDNLPVTPTFIMLSPKNDALYFLGRNQQQSGVFRIDLTADSSQSNIELVMDMVIRQDIVYQYTPDLRYLSLHDIHTGNMTILNMETLTVHSELQDLGTFPDYALSADGQQLIYSTTDFGLASRDTLSGEINWAITEPSMFYPSVNSDGSIFAMNNDNSFNIQPDTGEYQIISAFGRDDILMPDQWDIQYPIADNTRLIMAWPGIWCITGYCGVATELNIRRVDFNTGTQTQLFEHPYPAGSDVVGRFTGELLYTVPYVDLLDHWLWLMLMMMAILATAFKVGRKHRQSS